MTKSKKIQELENRLKQNGHRLTRARRGLLKVLCQAAGPLTTAEIIRRLRQAGCPANRATVYRELAFLEQEQIIRPVSLLDGGKRFEINGEHYHHLICLNCQAIKNIAMPNDLKAKEKSLGKKEKFKIISHSLEFYGLCSSCQK